MSKTLMYRLFRIGRIPPKLRSALGAEGMVLFDEGIPGRAYMKVFRAPGKRFKRRIVWFTGFLAVTDKRLLAHAFFKRVINVPLNDQRLLAIDCQLNDAMRIEFSFDPKHFHPEWSGDMALRFTTPHAREFFKAVKAAQDGLK
jgi:hypothetical protein